MKLSLSTGEQLFVGRVENAAKKATAIDEGGGELEGEGEMSPFPLSGKAQLQICLHLILSGTNIFFLPPQSTLLSCT